MFALAHRCQLRGIVPFDDEPVVQRREKVGGSQIKIPLRRSTFSDDFAVVLEGTPQSRSFLAVGGKDDPVSRWDGRETARQDTLLPGVGKNAFGRQVLGASQSLGIARAEGVPDDQDVFQLHNWIVVRAHANENMTKGQSCAGG